MRRMLMAVLATVVMATGCSSPSPVERVVAAAARTVEEGSARLVQRVEMTPPAGAGQTEPTVATARGTIDFDDAEGTMTVSVGGEEFEMVVRGGVIYQHLPALAAAAGKEWVRIDLDTIGEAAGVEGLGDLVRSQSNDPSASLQYLRGVRDSVKEVGKESIRGARTTWYESTVDIEKAAASAPEGQRRTIRQAKDVLGLSEVPTEVWLDGDGRVRRLKQTIDYSGAARSGRFPAGSLPGSMEITVEFFDFGAPVSVELPPADQVADYADILERARKGLGSGTATPETDALVPRLLTDVPAGYERRPDNVGDTGPSDLDKAVRDDGQPDARQVLEKDGFVAGYQRLWTKDEEGTIVDFVYRFSSADGAAHYRDRTLDSLGEVADTTEFPVPGVPGAEAVRIVEDDEHTAVVLVTRGGLLGQIVVAGPDAASDDVPVALALQQYERLG